MKKKNVFKLFCFLLMIYLFIMLGKKDYHLEVSDNIRFSNEYKDINRNNIYKYVNDGEVLDVLNGKSGVIFNCFSSNIWCHYYAEYLNEVALDNHLQEVYYYDFKRDRSLKNITYNSIVSKLNDYISYDDNGKGDLYAPSIMIIINGQVSYFLDEVKTIKGKVNPEDYFTDYKKNLLKSNLDEAIKEYLQKK
ncbi:MAG: hypothetical protein HFJ02_06110 [Bacilli bacterium]|nr:hypothetical protein [Bacilli bacterium]